MSKFVPTDSARSTGSLTPSTSELMLEKRHNHTIQVLFQLSDSYREMGKHQQAVDILEHALAIEEKHYGSTHIKLGVTLDYLGDAYGNLGEHQKELAVFNRAFKLRIKHYGRSHPEVARTLVSMSYSYRDLGNTQRAFKLLTRALVIQKEHYGIMSMELINTLLALNDVCGTLGLERVLKLQKKYYGNAAIETAEIAVSLGLVWHQLRQSQHASALLKNAYAILEKHYGSEHAYVKRVLKFLNLVSQNVEQPSPQPMVSGTCSMGVTASSSEKERLAEMKDIYAMLKDMVDSNSHYLEQASPQPMVSGTCSVGVTASSSEKERLTEMKDVYAILKDMVDSTSHSSKQVSSAASATLAPFSYLFSTNQCRTKPTADQNSQLNSALSA
jgi:tetratricopeptide (TPR) repeat protein